MRTLISRHYKKNMVDINGKVGQIADFYFDDRTWTLTHVALNNKRGEILHIQAALLGKMELPEIRLSYSVSDRMNFTDSKKVSPIMHTDYKMSNVFGWPNLWSIHNSSDDEDGLLCSISFAPHLRSIKEVKGYRIQDGNKFLGYITDFIVDEANHKIEQIVIHKNIIPLGRKIYYSTDGLIFDKNFPTVTT